jgi:hypothetical protein
VDAFLADEGEGAQGEIAAVRTGPDGTFVLKANPRRSPIREALARSNGPVSFQLSAIANTDGLPRLIGFADLARMAKGGRWVEGQPVTIQASNGPKAGC